MKGRELIRNFAPCTAWKHRFGLTLAGHTVRLTVISIKDLELAIGQCGGCEGVPADPCKSIAKWSRVFNPWLASQSLQRPYNCAVEHTKGKK